MEKLSGEHREALLALMARLQAHSQSIQDAQTKQQRSYALGWRGATNTCLAALRMYLDGGTWAVIASGMLAAAPASEGAFCPRCGLPVLDGQCEECKVDEPALLAAHNELLSALANAGLKPTTCEKCGQRWFTREPSPVCPSCDPSLLGNYDSLPTREALERAKHDIETCECGGCANVRRSEVVVGLRQ